VTFNLLELMWLTKIVNKRANMANAAEHKKRDPKLVKALKVLAKKLREADSIELKLNRVELRIINQLVSNHLEHAATYSLPAYAARLDKTKTNHIKHEEWKEKVATVQNLAKMLADLKNKIGDAL
jgi:hypothetical protein